MAEEGTLFVKRHQGPKVLTMEQLECPHPPRAQKEDSNPSSVYIKCQLCKCRTNFFPKSSVPTVPQLVQEAIDPDEALRLLMRPHLRARPRPRAARTRMVERSTASSAGPQYTHVAPEPEEEEDETTWQVVSSKKRSTPQGSTASTTQQNAGPEIMQAVMQEAARKIGGAVATALQQQEAVRAIGGAVATALQQQLAPITDSMSRNLDHQHTTQQSLQVIAQALQEIHGQTSVQPPSTPIDPSQPTQPQ